MVDSTVTFSVFTWPAGAVQGARKIRENTNATIFFTTTSLTTKEPTRIPA
jgi:hypothetical protein